MDVADAKAILRETGIDSVTDGTNQTVTGQLPPAGTQVPEGFCAMLYVTQSVVPGGGGFCTGAGCPGHGDARVRADAQTRRF